MTPAQPTPDEARRLEILRQYAVLDSQPEQALDDLTALAAHICGAPIAMISLVDENRQWYKSKVGVETKETTRDISFCGHAVQQRELFIVPDATQDERFADNPMVTGQPGIRFYAGAPLVSPEGTALGALCVIDRVARSLTEAQRQALKVLARQVMTHLELSRFTRALAKSEAELHFVMDNASVGLAVVNRDRRFTFANRAYAELLGLPEAAIAGQRIADVLSDVYVDRVKAALDRAFAGERTTYEVPQGDGGATHYEVRYEPRRISGEVALVVVVITNLTERMAVAAAAHRMAAIVESSDDAIIGKDLKSLITSWNRGAEKIFGYTSAEMVGTSIMRLIPAERQEEEEQILEKIRRGQSVESFDTLRQAKDGRLIDVAVTASPIKDSMGRPIGVSKIARDISGRKRAEAVLRTVSAQASSHRRTRILRDSATIILLAAAVYTIGHVYDVFDPLFNYFAYKNHQLNSDLNEVVATIVFFGVAMMVFSYRRVREKRAEALSQAQVAKALSVMHAEMEALVRQRTAELLQANADLRKEMLERQSAQAVIKQFPAIIESSDDAIISKTLDGVITSWNPAAERMFGYTAREIIGKPIMLLFPPDRFQEETEVLAKIERGQRIKHFETVRKRKDGRPVEVSVTISPIKDADGKIVGASKIVRDISERKANEEQLLWRTAFFEAQINSALDGILVVDSQGKTILQNQGMIDLWKYPKEMVEQADDQPRLAWVTSRIKDSEAFAEKVSYLYAHPEEISQDEIQLVDGRVFDRYSAPVKGVDGKYYGRIWSFRDSTERKRAQEQIAEQAALLDKARDAIIVRDLTGKIFFWNHGAERMYGYSRQEVLGKSASQILYATPSQFEELNQLVINKGEWSGELQHLTKDRKELTVEARWTLIRDHTGQPKSVLVINTDITEKKKVEAQFMRAQRMESIGTLAGGVAHDLNNILSPIMMSIDILKSMAADPDAAKILETIEVSAKRGADIVRQVLSFARGLEGERIEVQPVHLLKDLASIIRDTFPKDIRLKFSIPKATWLILGDPTQVHQILLNLCVNARDAMPSGGSLTVGIENCVLDEQYAAMNVQAKAGNYVLITVTDSGTGIPADIIDKIFEPFFTTKALNKGTGLGLSTVMAIVKSHSGIVNVYSEPGKGTTFKIYLPALESSAGVQPGSTEVANLPRGNGELILLVDDEASILSITSQTLQAFGYRVLTATDGADALAVYVQHKDEIAAVLTDMMMPVMDGSATIYALMRINPAVKIIAVSGLNENGNAIKSSHSRIKYFLTKPYSAGTLLKTINTLLKEESASVEPRH